LTATARSILFVAYFYPPSTDTGAHRPAAMVKYLRRLGHRVTVLTTSAFGTEPGMDENVLRARDLQLLRARLHGADRIEGMFDSDTYSGKPHPLSYVLIPEPLVAAWAPFARSQAVKLHRNRRFDCVITSSPPESAHLIGRTLSGRGVAWVADLRDAWTFEPLRPRFPTRPQRWADERLERRLMRAADVAACVSRPVAEDMRARIGANAVVVPNGWDPELSDAPGADAAGLLDPERVSLVYTGRFGSYGRDPRPLVRALGGLAAEKPNAAARLELAIAGPLTEDEARLFTADLSPVKVTLLGSLPRSRALALQREADALLLIAAPGRSQLANLKLFEYLAAGRPVLALAAGTEAGRIVADASAGEVVRADDHRVIEAALERVAGGEIEAPEASAAREYAYPGVAERMAAAVELAIDRHRS
jgi:glycosyltransferase involved in cell wall biosynthesis